MVETANLALLLLAVAMAVPVLFLAVQLGAALLPARAPAQLSSVPCPLMAVVMPAHNEEAIVARTVGSIVAQLPANGRLLVVADNCTDNTAQIASRAGAEVTLRRDANRIGKGYALDHGVRILSADPPQVVIFVDADCEVGQGSLEILAKHCASTGRPAQARYSMLLPPSASSADKVSQLAWVIKTLVRPLGSARLGLPCQLMGSGMALPFEIACQLNLATGHLAEDQKLGAELALDRQASALLSAGTGSQPAPAGRIRKAPTAHTMGARTPRDHRRVLLAPDQARHLKTKPAAPRVRSRPVHSSLVASRPASCTDRGHNPVLVCGDGPGQPAHCLLGRAGLSCCLDRCRVVALRARRSLAARTDGSACLLLAEDPFVRPLLCQPPDRLDPDRAMRAIGRSAGCCLRSAVASSEEQDLKLPTSC